MQSRPLGKNQGCGDRQNSNPISTNLRRLGPKKRIGPEHVTTPEYSDPASRFRIESQNQRLVTSGSATRFWADARTFQQGYSATRCLDSQLPVSFESLCLGVVTTGSVPEPAILQ